MGAGGGTGVISEARSGVTVLIGPGVGVLVDLNSRTGVAVGMTRPTGSTVVAGVGAGVGDAGGSSATLAPHAVAKMALNINVKSQKEVIRIPPIIPDSADTKRHIKLVSLIPGKQAGPRPSCFPSL